MKKKKKGKSRTVKASRSSQSRRSNRKYKSRSVRAKGPWVPFGQTATVAGRNIWGMVYVGRPPIDEDGIRADSGFIDPRLPVASTGIDYHGHGINYWPPNYTDMSEQSRAAYLYWLASDRSGTNYSASYVLLYFIGLERRFFFDTAPLEERILIISEVERLLEIYVDDSVLDSCLGNFVSATKLIMGLDQNIAPSARDQHSSSYTAVLAAIGIMADMKKPLNGEQLLNWYLVTHNLHSAILRVFPEFKALFISFFDEKYPQGLKIQVSDYHMSVTYHAISFDYHIDLSNFIGPIPNVSDQTRPLYEADSLADEVQKALEGFGRYLGNSPERRETIKAYALLPARIRHQFPCREAEELSSWAKKLINNNAYIQSEKFFEKLEGRSFERISRTQLIKAVDKLAYLSIGLAPDPRFTLYSLKPGDSVVLYQLPEATISLDEASENYWNTFQKLIIACFIAHSDGHVSARERNQLNTLISIKKLTPTENIRLRANFRWMLLVPPKLPMIRQNLKKLPELSRQDLGQIALSMAVVDGTIPPEKVEAIKTVYKLLELDIASVYNDLHSHSIGSEPAIVRFESNRQQAFAIPSARERNTKFELDSIRIDSVMDDTARVSAVLGDIFVNDKQDIELDERNDETELLPGLDYQHAVFVVELIGRNHWEDEEFERLAAQFNLMPGGALETLNEWAFEQFEEALIEEYEGYNLNSDVVEQLNTI